MVKKIIHLDVNDNVVIAAKDLKKGESITGFFNGLKFKVKLKEDIKLGHKVAITNLEKDMKIIKYGFCIGHATRKIETGEHIHFHNLEGEVRLG